MKRAGLILAALAILGCARGSTTWNPVTANPDHFKRDNYDCQREALSLHTLTPIRQRGMYIRCMQARGYELE